MNPDEATLFRTRASLLQRLKDNTDQDGWREFFETYWRLIYGVARRSGLSDSEAQDLVQETLVVVARQMPGFRYDPARGSFKAWLHTVIRGRLSRHWRRRRFRPEVAGGDPVAGDRDDPAGMEDPAAASEFEAGWQREWEQNLMDAALRRVQAKVSSRQYLLFSLAVLKEVPVATICERYEASLAQVYLARHRVGKQLRAEIARLRVESGG